MKGIKIQEIDIEKIIENPDNPRVIKDEKFKELVKSITDFPQMLFLRPIVLNDQGMALGGNQRTKACKEAGMKKVPVIYAKDLTGDQQKEFIIKDNVSSGEWDWSIINGDWDVEALDGWGVDIVKFGNTDMLNAVNKGDENSEWVGMPEFEVKEQSLKIIINFENEEDRIKFAKIHKLKFMKKEARWWSTQYPFKGRDDLKSQKHDVEPDKK